MAAVQAHIVSALAGLPEGAFGGATFDADASMTAEPTEKELMMRVPMLMKMKEPEIKVPTVKVQANGKA